MRNATVFNRRNNTVYTVVFEKKQFDFSDYGSNTALFERIREHDNRMTQRVRREFAVV